MYIFFIPTHPHSPVLHTHKYLTSSLCSVLNKYSPVILACMCAIHWAHLLLSLLSMRRRPLPTLAMLSSFLKSDRGEIYRDSDWVSNSSTGSSFVFSKQLIVLCLYLYSVQYLNVVQDSKHYMTHPTAQVVSNSQVTDIPPTGIQRFNDDHLSMATGNRT